MPFLKMKWCTVCNQCVLCLWRPNDFWDRKSEWLSLTIILFLLWDIAVLICVAIINRLYSTVTCLFVIPTLPHPFFMNEDGQSPPPPTLACNLSFNSLTRSSCNFKARLYSSFVDIMAVKGQIASFFFLTYNFKYYLCCLCRGGNVVDLEKSAKAIQVNDRMKGAMYFT